MSSIYTLENQPFLTFLSGILDSHYFSKGHSEPLRILEVGCGAGHFARIFSSTYGSKVNVTAIDESEAVIAKAKELCAGFVDDTITFLQADFNKYSNEVPYDLIIFTKSFHHCLPIDKAAENALKLLKKNGLIVAEELIRDVPPAATIRWFFDRYDLLVASKVIDPSQVHGHGHHGEQATEEHDAHNHEHNHGHSHGDQDTHSHGHHGIDHAQRMRHFSDPTVEPLERWMTFYNVSLGLPMKQEIIDSISNVFGSANTRVIDTLPFLYHHLVFCGLKSDEAGQATIAKFMVEEERAVRTGEIVAIGMNVIAEKME